MGVLGTSVVFVSCSLLVCLLFVLLKFIHRVWWTPIRIRHVMRTQGIRGPAYRFLYGNIKEILAMREESLRKPIGLSHNIFPRIQPHVYSWINIYGKNFLQWNGPKADLVVTESELVKELLNRDEVFQKTEVEGFAKKLLGDGLVTSNGEKWVKQRKLSNRVFHGESLKSMAPAMISSVEMMLERWKQHEGREIEVFQEFKLLTSEVISRTAFGSSYLEGKDIFEMLMKLGLLVIRNAFNVKLPIISEFVKSADDVESEKLEQGIRDIIVGMMKKREEAANGEIQNYGNDFLGLLVQANHAADLSNRITVQDVVDECKTFYLAGHETTSSLLTWAVLLLAIHTDWQEKAREEVLKLFGQVSPNTEYLTRLKTMTMIINESLRLYPPVLMISRNVKKDTKLGKLIVPANIHLVVPIPAIHQDTQIWGEDAHLFKPERFSEGVAKATNSNPAAFLPFALGPRNCVGMNFATNEAKIALSMILQRFTFTLSPTYSHSPIQILTTSPEHGVHVVLNAL